MSKRFSTFYMGIVIIGMSLIMAIVTSGCDGTDTQNKNDIKAPSKNQTQVQQINLTEVQKPSYNEEIGVAICDESYNLITFLYPHVEGCYDDTNQIPEIGSHLIFNNIHYTVKDIERTIKSDSDNCYFSQIRIIVFANK